MSLDFKPIDEISLSKETREYLEYWEDDLPNNGKRLYVLDGDIDGFRAMYFKSNDFVGVTVFLPSTGDKPQTKRKAMARLLQNVGTILAISVGKLVEADKTKVILHFVNLLKYFNGEPQRDLTPALTDVLNKQYVKGHVVTNYTGTASGYGKYLFELPYTAGMDESDKCSKYVKVDLNHREMKTIQAKAFFRRLGSDLSLCRGQSYLHHEIEEGPKANSVLYLMFRNSVPDSEWWKDMENITYICAAIIADIRASDRSMYLAAICSRPGTTGAVAEMLRNISTDASNSYGLDHLLLIPASKQLREIYKRDDYGFKNHDDRYMVKYLTKPKETAAAATYDFESHFAKLNEPWAGAAESESPHGSVGIDFDTFVPLSARYEGPALAFGPTPPRRAVVKQMIPRSTKLARSHPLWQEEENPWRTYDFTDVNSLRGKDRSLMSAIGETRTEGTGGKKKSSRRPRSRSKNRKSRR